MKLTKKFSGQYLLLCIFIFFITLTGIISFVIQIQNIKSYNDEISKLRVKIATTKDEINEYEKYNSYSDKKLESLAREKLGMVKPNEIIYLEK